MAARIGSPSFLALGTMLIGGVSDAASQGGPFWERKPNGPGFNISSGGSTPGEAEAFLDRKSLEF